MQKPLPVKLKSWNGKYICSKDWKQERFLLHSPCILRSYPGDALLRN